MPVIVRNLVTAIIAAIAVTATDLSAACEDIAALSDDARYIVLNADDLSIRDVGSLWWLGIRRVESSSPGSTLAAAALGVMIFDPVTGDLV